MELLRAEMHQRLRRSLKESSRNSPSKSPLASEKLLKQFMMELGYSAMYLCIFGTKTCVCGMEQDTPSTKPKEALLKKLTV